MTETNTVAIREGRELKISRLFRAPRDLVFSLWTDPKHLPNWWGPEGFTITIHEIDVKPGGVWRFVMHGPDGTDYDNRINYIEVVRPERLVYTHGDEEEENFRVTVMFEAVDKMTEVTMHMLFKSEADLEKAVNEYGAIEGAKSTLSRLANLLEQVISKENW